MTRGVIRVLALIPLLGRRMRSIVVGFFIVLLLLLLTCGSGQAQATAQISGIIKDQSGAVLPGAEITATQIETGVSRSTVSNETGSYALSNLPLGPYKLEASLPGFRSFVQTGIVLQVNASPTINISLQLGQVSEQVEVEANASLVETRNVSVGQVMETARIVDLPLNGRNTQELLLLGGGTVQTAPASGSSYPGRLLISGTGALSTSTDYTLDGIHHVDAYDGLPMPLPFPDALAEFKTEIGGLTAAQRQGTQVSAVTKSGTNEFHGDLFEFVRNDLLNARNYFAIKGSTLKRNQYGGTTGGAIIKNKLFLFGGYQGTILRQDPSDVRQFVPTTAMLAGDFSVFASPACNVGRQITLKAPFVNNHIDPSLFSTVALKVVARLPKSNDPCGLITFGQKAVNNERQYVGKLDYQYNPKQSVFGRLLYSDYDQPSPFQFTPDNPLNAKAHINAISLAFTAGSIYLINATTVNSFRVAFTRQRLTQVLPPYFDLTELGSNVYSGYAPHTAKVTVTNGFSLNGAGTVNEPSNLYQVSDDVSMTRGTHQFGFGVWVAHNRTNVKYPNTTAAPSFNFTGAVTGLGLADFLTGKVNDLSQGTNTDIFTRVKFFSLYAQDSWQLKPRLTMSYGLRWAPILPQQDVHRPVPYVLNFDINKYQQGIRSTVFVNAPPGLLFAGDPGFQQHNNGPNAAKPRADLWNPYWKDFEPHLGLAWDPQGNGRTSIRVSYGLSFDNYVTIDRLGTQANMGPYGSLTQLIAPAGGLDDPYRGVPGGNPFPITIDKKMSFVPYGVYIARPVNLSPTYDQSWNVTIQREIVPGTLLSVSYIGSEITHLQVADAFNQSIYVPGVGDASGSCFMNGKVTPYKVAPGAACSTLANTQDRRKFNFLNSLYASEYGRISTIRNPGTQSYNGMLVSVQRRPNKGFTLNANYTLSHCIGDYVGRTNGGYGINADQTYQDPTNRRRDRGNCDIDQRHTFNLTAVAETPKFPNRTLNWLGTGWRLAPLWKVFSGGTLLASSQGSGLHNVTLGVASGSQAAATGTDVCLCDLSNQRPNLLLPNNVYLNKSVRPSNQWLNPAAFGTPAVVTLGNLGHNVVALPTSWQFDASLSRTFHVRESQTVEFRAEAFNVLNRFRTGAIDTNFGSSTFGLIRNALDPRIMEFALKYLF